MEWLKKGVKELRGIGPKKAALLGRIGIWTFGDSLLYFPRDYEVHRGVGSIDTLGNGEMASLCLVFKGKPQLTRRGKNLSILRWVAEDDTGQVECIWFNQPYRGRQYQIGLPYYIYGKAQWAYGRLQIQNPMVEKYQEEKHNEYRAYPIYPLVQGLTQRDLRNILKQVLAGLPENMSDDLPQSLRERYGLVNRLYALNNIHFPKGPETLDKSRRRLVFEEFFILQMGLYGFRNENILGPGLPFNWPEESLQNFIKALPFKPTDAQHKVICEVLNDLKGDKPMNRLVYGDVGSGKTLIAAISLYVSYLAGYQGTIMAPTEILAYQHYKSLKTAYKDVFGKSPKLGLLVGSLKEKEKESIKASIIRGHIDIIIATHAILEEDVEFANLGLVVTDEQHRFGVRQRGILTQKGEKRPHIMVMSATPIPRTLALMLYGDLDISVIDELPPGRRPVKTYHVPSAMKERVYNFIKKQAAQGFQSYLVCPTIENSQDNDLSSVLQLYDEIKSGPLQSLSIGFVHGRVNPKEKEKIMLDFEKGGLDLLIATTVIEVGVNVPNANLMVIENAERFGLAQLHQLRGRVGRSSSQAYCILISDAKGERAKARMSTMEEISDGFTIAQRDLELRGPGEFIGIRQHGLPDFRLGDIIDDSSILKEAQEACTFVIELGQENPMFQTLLNYALKELEKKMKGIPLN